MSEIPKIHDKFFKEVFSRKAEMQDLIVHTFPIELVKNINFETLERDETEYLNTALEEHFSDLVYSCVYKKNVEIKIVLLFEHKSYIDKNIYFQILAYMLNIWEKCTKKDNTKPNIIIPIVFYHGKDTWNYEKFDNYFDYLDDNLRKYLPLFDFILINTKLLDDSNLLTDYKKTTAIAIFLLKYIFDKISLQNKIADFFGKLDNLITDKPDNDLYITFFLYLKQHLKTEEMETIMETITSKSPHINPFVKIFNEELINKGRELERKKQEKERELERKKQEKIIELERKKQEELKIEAVKKMILKGLTNEDIAYIIDFDVKKIENIRKLMID